MVTFRSLENKGSAMSRYRIRVASGKSIHMHIYTQVHGECVRTSVHVFGLEVFRHMCASVQLCVSSFKCCYGLQSAGFY